MRLNIGAKGQAGIAALLMICALGSPARAQSFSADLVVVNAAGAVSGKSGTVHVSNDKIRVETPELPNAFMVVEPTAETAYLVRPASHIFVDAKQSSRWTQLLVRVDPADPCLAWQAMAKVTGALKAGGQWRCARLGDEMLNGRATVKYQMTSPQGETNTGWIDAQLKFPLRLRGGDGAGIDLARIEEGPQADSLFAIPANFLKLDPQSIVDRVKHSDVYVAPPQ